MGRSILHGCGADDDDDEFWDKWAKDTDFPQCAAVGCKSYNTKNYTVTLALGDIQGSWRCELCPDCVCGVITVAQSVKEN